MIFMAVGIFLSPLGIGVAHIHIDSELVQTIAELALVIVLFSDASQLKLKELRYEWSIPTRLLLIGLPLTILFSAYIAHLFFPQELTTYVLLLALILGGILGSIVGYLSARISTVVIKNGWMLMEYKNLIPIALAVLAYFIAEHFGGNGFISAFFAGLFVGNYNQDLRQHIEDFAESEGDLLMLISFLVFGLVFIPPTIMYWDLKILIFSLLSLTLFRMLPVAISLIGSRLDMSTVLFIGWFGPRGIASILYTLTIVHEIGSIKGHEEIYAVISLTIFLSIILHGISAQPFVSRYVKMHKEK